MPPASTPIRKAMIGVAREAVQTAEDARAITVKKIEQERLENERQAAADTQAKPRRKPTTPPGRRNRHSLIRPGPNAPQQATAGRI